MNYLIQKLVETTAPSGQEKALRDLVREEVAGLADDLRVDALGSLIARKGQKTRKWAARDAVGAHGRNWRHRHAH